MFPCFSQLLLASSTLENYMTFSFVYRRIYKWQEYTSIEAVSVLFQPASRTLATIHPGSGRTFLLFEKLQTSVFFMMIDKKTHWRSSLVTIQWIAFIQSPNILLIFVTLVWRKALRQIGKYKIHECILIHINTK